MKTWQDFSKHIILFKKITIFWVVLIIDGLFIQ